MFIRLVLWPISAICVLTLLLSLGCSNSNPSAPASHPDEAGPPVDQGGGFFADVTAQTGIRHVYKNGHEADHYAILESLGGGAGLIDYNRDGRLDVFVTGGGYFGPNKEILGHPNRLFRNDGNWRFTDVTEEVGLPTTAGALFFSHGCAVDDYDRDGWPDLLVTGYGRLALFRNDKGKFVEVTEAAKLRDKRELHWSTSAAWADFDGDGYLDLYVSHYVDWSFKNHPRCEGYSHDVERDICPPKKFNPLPHSLYLNNKDGTFRDITQEAGIKPGKGLGVIVVDVNDDGRPDIYIANDTTENWLYLNQGGGKFNEVARQTGTDTDDGGIPNGSMGLAAADYDGSGRFSLFVTNYQNEQHALYRNLGGGQFRHVSRSAGITAIGLIYVGFGTGFIDYDLDGAEDIFIANGHVIRFPRSPGTLKQRPVLLRNTRKADDKSSVVRFADVTAQGGPYFRAQHIGRGVAFGDLDNDGRTDMVLNPTNEPVTVLRNVLVNGNHWLGVELKGKDNRGVVGSKLTLEAGGQKLVRGIMGGGSYLSAHDLRVIFGLGSEQKVGKLTVQWPAGQTQSCEGLAVDRYWRLVEGEEKAQEPSYK